MCGSTSKLSPRPVNRTWWQRLAPYFPLATAALEVPWVVLIAMSQMGGQGNYRNDPMWERNFGLACLLPATVGFFIGLYVLGRLWIRGPLEWFCFSIGLVLCAISTVNFCVGLAR